MSMTEEERSALSAIELDLRSADPAFAARMGASDASDGRSPRWILLCAAAYICLPIEALLFGWHIAVVTLVLAVTTVAVVLVERRRGRREP